MQRQMKRLVGWLLLSGVVVAGCGTPSEDASTGAVAALDAGPAAPGIDVGSSSANESADAGKSSDTATDTASAAAKDIFTGPPPPAKVIAQPPKDARVAGDPAKIRCIAQDADGAPVDVAADAFSLVVADPLKLVSLQAGLGTAVVTTKAGKWPVRCKLAAPELVSEPADVTYIAGAAASVTAVPEHAEITAGDAGTPVKCVLKDAFGNETATLAPATGGAKPADVKTSVDSSDDLKVYEGIARGEKAGTFPLTCTVQGAELTKLPAPLTVKPGLPDFSKAQLDKTAIKAGESVAVTCVAYDKFGNETAPQPADWKITTSAGCTAKSQSSTSAVTCTKAADHTVKCDAKEINEAVPAAFVVKPAAPVKLTLKLSPDLPNYQHGQKIQLTGVGTDAYGNIDDDVELAAIAAKPSGADVDQANARIAFFADGLYTVTAKAKSAPAVAASRQVRVDTNGPLINVSSPKQASTVIWASKFTVTFSAIDELSALGLVTVNGAKAKVGDGIGITHTIVGKHGLNVVKIVAKDEFGNENVTVIGFYAARKFVPSEAKDGIKALNSHGLEAFLGQKALDSGVRNHSKPRDLATVIEIVLKNLDVKTLIGQSFKINETLYKGEAQITKFTFGDPAVNKGYPRIKLLATSSGLKLDATIYKVLTDVYLKGTVWYSPSLTAQVTASSMSVSGLIKVSVSSSGKVTVNTSSVKVTLNGLKVKIKDGWGILVNWLLALFKGPITNLLQNTLQTQIGAAINGPLASALEAFALDQAFTIPGFYGGPPSPVNLKSTLQTLVSLGASSGHVGGLRLGMKASLTSVRKVPYELLGSVARTSCLKTYQTVAVMPRKSPMEVALHHDVVNQLLMAMWQGGGLKLTVPVAALGAVDLSQFQVSDLDVKAEFMLPPLVNDCVADGKPELQVGAVRLDVKAKLSGKQVVLRVYMSAAAKVAVVADAGVSGKEIGLNLGAPHLVEADVDSVLLEGKQAPVATSAFFQLLLPAVAGQLVNMLSGTLASFPLPALDLSLMTTAIPKGTVLALDIQSVYAKPGNVHADGIIK